MYACTKYLNSDGAGSGLIITCQQSGIVKAIALTSVNDAEDKVPTSFTLEGSNDGENFTEIAIDVVVYPYFNIRSRVVIGIDNMNDYYDTSIKYNNLNILHNYDQFFFYRVDVNETSIFYEHDYDVVCHLASRAGVRYSIEHPKCYVDDNIKSMVHILDCTVRIYHRVLACQKVKYAPLARRYLHLIIVAVAKHHFLRHSDDL